MKKYIALSVVTLFSVVLLAQEPNPVNIPSTQRLNLNSAIVGQEYDLLIHLPGNYNTNTDKTYPVLYLLDAQWDFPLVTGLYGSQYYDGFIPGIIIVGITWGGKDPDPGRLRFRDFTPKISNQPSGTGNADNFLAFLKKELIPFIDSKFRTKKDDRVLAGSSLGGLFTLYTLFTETSLFNRYFLTSPALQWGNGIVLQHERNFAKKNTGLPVKLFMAHGDMEFPAPFQRFVDTLKKRQYAGLELQTRILENTGHSGTKAEGYTRGLQWVFARPSLKLPATILNKYAGTYLVGTDTLKIIGESNRLIAIAPGNNRFALDAATENDFYLKGQFLNLHFKKDEAGNISGFRLERFEGDSFVKKISK
jgi:predicted alpha/beta superfamily hydrolase